MMADESTHTEKSAIEATIMNIEDWNMTLTCALSSITKTKFLKNFKRYPIFRMN